jgi:hypothetical protein
MHKATVCQSASAQPHYHRPIVLRTGVSPGRYLKPQQKQPNTPLLFNPIITIPIAQLAYPPTSHPKNGASIHQVSETTAEAAALLPNQPPLPSHLKADINLSVVSKIMAKAPFNISNAHTSPGTFLWFPGFSEFSYPLSQKKNSTLHFFDSSKNLDLCVIINNSFLNNCIFDFLTFQLSDF